MLRISIFLFIVMCVWITADAQQLTVRDRASGRGLEHVIVRGVDGQVRSTDADGRADLAGLAPGTRLRVELIGYASQDVGIDELRERGYTVYLEEKPFRMEEVIVSATRWKQPQRDVPSRTIAVREGDVLLANPQTAADLLAASGEVYVQKSQLGGGSPMIRGFATNRVLIAVDGVRMNTAIFRTGNVQNVINLDPLATERTEVLFGPGAVMYGSDAIGGVMSFSTLGARYGTTDGLTFSGNAYTRGSSANGEKTGHVDLEYELPRWGFVTSFTYSDYGDLRMGSHGPDDFLRTRYVERINGVDSILTNGDPELQVPSGYSQWNVMQKIRHRPAEGWDLSYGFHYSRTSDYARYDRLTRPRGSGLRSAEWYYGPQTWMLHSLAIENSGGSVLYDNLRATLAYQRFGESRHDRDFGKPTLFHRTESVDAISVNLDASKALAEKYTVSYGAELLHNTVGSTGENEDVRTGVSIPGSTRYPDGATWQAAALYANLTWSVLPALSLQAGARYSFISLRADFDTTYFHFPFTTAAMDNGAMSGSLGAVYRPIEALALHGVLSSGFRAPNVDDVGKVFDSAPGAVVVPNPDLRPEYAYNAELGASLIIDEVVKIDVTAFSTLLRDALVRRNFTLNGQDSILYDGSMSRVQAIQNAAEAHVSGVQARLELRLPGGFGVTSHFTTMSGDEELDDGSTGPLRHVAPWYGTTRLTYTMSRIDADVSAVYNGTVSAEDLAPGLEGKDYLYALDDNGKPHVPGWVTLNLKLRYMPTDFLQITAGIENIGDIRYRTYSSGISAPGRNYIGAIRLSL